MAQVERMKAIFKEWDADGNGTISRDEMTTVMRKLGSKFSDEQFEQMFSTVDANQNGQIEYNEFIEWLTATASQVSVTNAGEVELFDLEGALMPLFKVYDKKNTGNIDLEEFREAYGIVTGALKLDAEQNGKKIEFGCAESTFNSIDTGGEGYITFAEFVKWQKDNVKDSGLTNKQVADLFTSLAELVDHVFELSKQHGQHKNAADYNLPVLLNKLENLAGTASKLFHASAHGGKEPSTGFSSEWPAPPEGKLCVDALVHFHMNKVPVPVKGVKILDTHIENILPEKEQTGSERKWIARIDRITVFEEGKTTKVPYYYAWTEAGSWAEAVGSDFMDAYTALAPEFRFLGILYTEAEFGQALKWDCMMKALDGGVNEGVLSDEVHIEFEDKMHELVTAMLRDQLEEEPDPQAVEDNLTMVVELSPLQVMSFLAELGAVPHHPIWDTGPCE